MSDSDKAVSSARRYWLHWLITLLGLLTVVLFVTLYEPARGVAWEAFRLFFALVSTPFVLEFTVGVFGVCILLYLNARRRAKEEEDEWVYLDEVEPPGEDESRGDSEKPEGSGS